MYQPPRLNVALGLGDQELEQRLRPALEAADDLAIVAQCLAADQLLEVVQSDRVDAVVVAWSLHRLSDTLLNELYRPGVSLVLLVPDPADARWHARPGAVLGLAADAAAVRQAILAARPGVRPASRPRAAAEPLLLKPADRAAAQLGSVIAVAGGVGSPGRTTLSINLAAALGATASTVLVEADLCAPAVAAYLDADPSRNLCTLAHAVRDDPHLWSVALADELQALGPHPVSSLVLCGPPKREMRTSIAPPFMEQLVRELAQRYRWVVLDVGPELLGVEAAAASHRVALARAEHVLLVTAADLVGLWHARTAIDQLEHLVGIERSRVSLILNRHDPRHHHPPQEVAWHLGASVAAVIPFDYMAAQRAIAEQRPLVLDPSSRAGRAVLALAGRLVEGKVRLAPASGAARSNDAWWRRILRRRPAEGSPGERLSALPTRFDALSDVRGRMW
jgi:Mrp family chromosome partitioning ATPase